MNIISDYISEHFIKNYRFNILYLISNSKFSMEDKSISRKRLNVYKKKHLSKKKRSYKTETIEYCYLNTYNPLSRNFNNITMWLNLTFVNISSSMITILPSTFGKLGLVTLNLSKNYLGSFGSTKWLWIEQNAIRNTLSFLNISNNSVSHITSNY